MQQQIGAAVMSPEEMRARHLLISNSPKYRRYLAEKACTRDCAAPADSAGDCLVGSGRLSRRAEPTLDAEAIYLGPEGEMRGLGADCGCSAGSIRCSQRRRRWIGDWRAFLLLKMRREVSR